MMNERINESYFEENGYEKDPYFSRVENVRFGIYDSNNELICKVTNMYEATATRKELRDIDLEETGKKNKYYIRKLWGT